MRKRFNSPKLSWLAISHFFVTAAVAANEKCNDILNAESLGSSLLKIESTRKQFGQLLTAYDFFTNHSSERVSNAMAVRDSILAWIGKMRKHPNQLRILDFGGGDGEFLSTVLELSDLRVSTITLVEPTDSYHAKAESILQRFAFKGVHTVNHLDVIRDEQFDIIISNHVLYYVPNLKDSVEALLGMLSSNGLALFTMAKSGAGLVSIAEQINSNLGRPYPFYRDEHIVNELRSQEINFAAKMVYSTLIFPYTVENITHLNKFIMGIENDQSLPFDKYRHVYENYRTLNGQFHLDIIDHLYEIKK